MALSNYTDLQASIASWLDRSDLTSYIPDFISLAEARLNRKLRLTQMETTTTGTVSTDTISFPADCLSVSKVQINASYKYILSQMTKEELIRKYPYDSQEIPKSFAVNGNQIQIRPYPDQTYTYALSYYQKIPDLATNTTNWLLTLYPDIYLHASLLAAEIFIQNDEGITKQAALLAAFIDEANMADKHNRFGGGTLQMVAS